MASAKVSKQIRTKVSEFMKSRKNSNCLVDIVTLMEANENNVQPCILALELIFVEVFKKREMIDASEKPTDEVLAGMSAEQMYSIWIRNCYEDIWRKLLIILEKHKFGSQQQALSTLMKFISLEGKVYRVLPLQTSTYYFPADRLKDILVKILSSEMNTSHLINRFQEYTSYYDVLFNVWKLLPQIALQHSRPNEVFVRNFLDLMDKSPLPKENEQIRDQKFLCGDECFDESAMTMTFDQFRKYLNKTWGCVMHWAYWLQTPSARKQLLVVLLERVLPYMDKPLLLTDFLMDSLDIGGVVSVLALQGVFTLIQHHNLDYPNIFTKLYSMFEPEIFHTKYKARLFFLSDMFLSSTHLPENLVAAFAKRLARLTLVAPPQDILVILMFIGNLLMRHPGLKRLIHHPTGGIVNSDPYIMDEREPTKSNAIESSLWEIQILQDHVIPTIASAARFINSPLPTVEWDLSEVLEFSTDDMFEKELKKKAKEITLTFERPNGMSVPNGEKILEYWNLM